MTPFEGLVADDVGRGWVVGPYKMAMEPHQWEVELLTTPEDYHMTGWKKQPIEDASLFFWKMMIVSIAILVFGGV